MDNPPLPLDFMRNAARSALSGADFLSAVRAASPDEGESGASRMADLLANGSTFYGAFMDVASYDQISTYVLAIMEIGEIFGDPEGFTKEVQAAALLAVSLGGPEKGAAVAALKGLNKGFSGQKGVIGTSVLDLMTDGCDTP